MKLGKATTDPDSSDLITVITNMIMMMAMMMMITFLVILVIMIIIMLIIISHHPHLNNFDDTDKTEGKACDDQQKRENCEKQSTDSRALLACWTSLWR